MTFLRHAINAPLFLIALFALVLAAVRPHPAPTGPRFAELLEARGLLNYYDIDSPTDADLIKSAWDGALALANQRHVPTTSIQQPRVENDYATAFWDLENASRGRASESELMQAALRGMTASLHDLHTRYVPEPDWDGIVNGTPVRFTPAFLYRPVRTPAGLVVQSVTPASSAEYAGLKVGDQIVSINGVGSASTQAPKIKPDQPNSFIVKRPQAGIVKLKIRIEPERAHPFENRFVDGFAYIRLYAEPPLDFQAGGETFAAQLDRAMQSMASSRPSGWILDLRGNSGGYPNTVALLAGYFNVEGRIDVQTDKTGFSKVTNATDRSLMANATLVVITDGRTVSAGEILASDLKENGAHLIGSKTRGAVRGALYKPLSQGGGLEISTVNVKVGKAGANLEGVGVTPDEVVPLDPAQALLGHDNQLDRAIAYLHEVTGSIAPAGH